MLIQSTTIGFNEPQLKQFLNCYELFTNQKLVEGQDRMESMAVYNHKSVPRELMDSLVNLGVIDVFRTWFSLTPLGMSVIENKSHYLITQLAGSGNHDLRPQEWF